jgi:DNA-directed RNA polymerase subunit K/omega
MGYTRFEKARVIGARALQLAMGAPLLIKPGKNSSMLELAEEEMEKSVIPITVVKE